MKPLLRPGMPFLLGMVVVAIVLRLLGAAPLGTSQKHSATEKRWLEIWEIQGEGATSPFDQHLVRTRDNVVTAVGPKGFFVQTPANRSDRDPSTSDGIYVYVGRPSVVEVGDLVDVHGRAVEFFGMTEIASATKVIVTKTRCELPEPIRFDRWRPSPLPSRESPQHPNPLERYEGMRVAFSGGIVTGPTDRFGEVKVAARDRRTFREPGVRFPGPSDLPPWDGNPEVFELAPNALGGSTAELAGGTSICFCEGALTFNFGEYQVWPTVLSVSAPRLPRPVRSRHGDEFTVATQNLFRLFDTDDDPLKNDLVLTGDELDLRLSKLSRTVVEMLDSPDLVAVQEVENRSVLEELAVYARFLDPRANYRAFTADGNDPSGMDVGFLVGPRVEVRNVRAIGEDVTFVFAGSTRRTFPRPPLVIDAFFGGTTSVRVVNVHLKSLRNIETDIFVRTLRREQARWLAARIQELQSSSTIPLLVIGDLNAFEFTDGYVDVLGALTGTPDPRGALLPVDTPVSPPLENLTWRVPPDDRYSFVFSGNAQTLDHVLTSRPLSPLVRDIQFARGNADAPVAFRSDPSTPLGASDHDGLVLFLDTSLGVPWFVRGDASADGSIDRADVFEVLRHLFAGGKPPSCWDAADANADGQVDLSDALSILDDMYGLGPPSRGARACEPATSAFCRTTPPCRLGGS